MSTNKSKIFTPIHSVNFKKTKVARREPLRLVRWEDWNPTQKYGGVIKHYAAMVVAAFEDIYDVSILEVNWELWPALVNELVKLWKEGEVCVRKAKKVFDMYFKVNTTKETITNIPVYSSSLELQ